MEVLREGVRTCGVNEDMIRDKKGRGGKIGVYDYLTPLVRNKGIGKRNICIMYSIV